MAKSPIANESAKETGLQPEPIELTLKKIEQERYLARLSFWKFMWSSVFVAVVVAVTPSIFQYATGLREIAKANAERELKHLEFQEKYISEFLSYALNQEIEYRLRFAEYFSFVSDPRDREGWEKYVVALRSKKEFAQQFINETEDLYQKAGTKIKDKSQIEVDKLERMLRWKYSEIELYKKRASKIAAAPHRPFPGV